MYARVCTRGCIRKGDMIEGVYERVYKRVCMRGCMRGCV